MGNLLHALKDRNGKKITHDFFIDFESASPNGEEEQAVYDKVNAVLSRTSTILDELEGYGGAGDQIRGVRCPFPLALVLPTHTPNARAAALYR